MDLTDLIGILCGIGLTLVAFAISAWAWSDLLFKKRSSEISEPDRKSRPLLAVLILVAVVAASIYTWR